MNRNNAVIIIEDDPDDQYLLEVAFKRLDYVNELVFFPDGQSALDYLEDTGVIPFIILSDINMPKLDGFALRNRIFTDGNLQKRCIPFLFFSTAADQSMVIKAYSLSVQGFFTKQAKINELEKTLSVIMEYWKRCAAPNNYR